ncbi:Hpt domain-containing protein [Flammeovirga pacifica]|uniref:HPt domain-containing protein n=1 Tax=Flammeovirga pacifica TaxID=915059 RepID=A0A1S1Z268_FLAPC|nr:Hpt domain-containing protein [Flammeovirga pacifica]OHX67332.1 hypothetical protein NH26_13750 [Flammeovirga pacifica]
METNYLKTYRTIPLIKQNVWIKIKNFVREEQLGKLLHTFEDDLNELISKAKFSVQTKKKEELDSCLHTLKGIAGTIGASRLQIMAKEAESLDINTINENHFIEKIEKCGIDSLREMTKL